MRTARELESEFLRGVNAIVEPLVRAGFGFPRFWLTGLIVMEMQGRRSGCALNVPLLATKLGDLVLVSTVRSRRSHSRSMGMPCSTSVVAHGVTQQARVETEHRQEDEGRDHTIDVSYH